MEEKKFIVLACESEDVDIQVETLKPGQGINLFGLYIPFGIESKISMKCVVKEVTEKENRHVEEDLGEIYVTVESDEGKFKHELKMTSDLPKKLEEIIGIKIF